MDILKYLAIYIGILSGIGILAVLVRGFRSLGKVGPQLTIRDRIKHTWKYLYWDWRINQGGKLYLWKVFGEFRQVKGDGGGG